MFLSALVWALAYASEDSQSLTLPWEMKLLNADVDCPQLCGNWSALYLSDNGCKGASMELLTERDTDGAEVDVGKTLRFCPDKDAVEAWTLEKEVIYAAMHRRRNGLLKPEREIFKRMTTEREMKLSVHPWQKFPTQEIGQVLERRRIKANPTRFMCQGEKSGTKHVYRKSEKPEKVFLKFDTYESQTVMRYIEMKYPTGHITVGSESDLPVLHHSLPDCVQVVFLKTDGTYMNGLQFLSQGKETKFFGSDENDAYIYIAPSGKCLGDMRIRGDEIIERICFKFNADM